MSAVLKIWYIRHTFYSCIWRLIHSIRRFTIFSCCISLNSTPFGTRYHLFRQPRQQHAHACCAINTGWPCIGVCLPSFGITAGVKRCLTKSYACRRIVSMPLSFSVNEKLERNFEVFNFCNASSIVCKILFHLFF